MRVKTQAKREAILQEASKAFIELGFERTSMAEISARAGGSKATLYGYFASKEQLFLEVVLSAGEKHVQPAIEELSQSVEGEEQGALQRFGEDFIGYLCQPEAVSIQRMVIAESGHTEIGRLFFEAGPQMGNDKIAKFLKRAMSGGHLRRADPMVAAEHLLGLLTAELMPKRLLGLPVNTSTTEIRKIVGRAVTAFMAAYAV